MDNVLADTLKEEWRPIDGFGGEYLVSSLGRVLSLPKCQHIMLGDTARDEV